MQQKKIVKTDFFPFYLDTTSLYTFKIISIIYCLILICFFLFFIIILENNYCGNEEFQCHDGLCLSIDKRCNGKTECNNGEDEVNCHRQSESFGSGTTQLFYLYLFVYVVILISRRVTKTIATDCIRVGKTKSPPVNNFFPLSNKQTIYDDKNCNGCCRFLKKKKNYQHIILHYNIGV